MDVIQDLEYRDLLFQVTDKEELRKALEKPITLYCGFDPTADSLHVGNLLQIVVLKRFQDAGHKPIALVGGGTGLIGDPSGRSTERQLNEQNIVEAWGGKLKDQLSRFLNFSDGDNRALLANNYDWLSSISLISFLRDIGKHFPINYMLSKDSVTSRMDSGISYTEFSYMMLQAYDYLNLFEKEGARLQIGGSDQWGNITAGLELIRRSGHEEQAFGLTMPLITNSDGQKLGKSMGNGIWLDPVKTTPYEFYQFWINTDDRDVIRFIKYFTFLSKEEIDRLEKEVKTAPEKRVAQKRLAEELTTFVHGEDALQQAIKITEALFSGDIKSLSASDIQQGFKDVPSYTVETKEDIGLIDLLVQAGVSPSKRQAREDISNGAIYINGERQTEMGYIVTEQDRIEDQFILLRRGKKKYTLVQY
ncbi:tyrosyl-tRNA synthetase [Pullulanibacillus pueri]|uniref:Tyrosine--tRNA ligase n=1 Tax=Pullulanibacillus pueri TaxID=1437324 RepID=A0A8J2ZU35_9BACL|nr:tyrosine--tRNA ligase [Pullulanibacillus pueri]MBM7681173.1 tyrosyl-tRNA synthetase [Pullulanibacillus pueri]GGH77333.1 tyrosine--tRNA ligase 1 [Pullulanibacillus pueri]